MPGKLTDIILIPPLKSHRQIMRVQDPPPKQPQQLLALLPLQLINPLRKRSDRKQTLPPRDRVRPHNRVHRAQLPAHIRRRPARPLVHDDLLRVRSRGLQEAVADKRRREPFQKAPVGGRKAIVQLVAAGPERVASRAGQLRQAQRGVVRGHGLELDVGVPLGGVVAAGAGAGADFVGEEFLAREGGDGADFGVGEAEFGGAVEDGVGVQGAGGGFVGCKAEGVDECFLEGVG